MAEDPKLSYTRFTNANFLNELLVQGEPVVSGAAGNSFFFESLAARDTFFNTGTNSVILRNGLPVMVNQNTQEVVYTWSGVDAPISYDAALFLPATQAIKIPAVSGTAAVVYLDDSDVVQASLTYDDDTKQFEVVGSDLFVINTDTLLVGDMDLISATPGSPGRFSIFSADGDNTDGIFLELNSLGTARTDPNREFLSLGYSGTNFGILTISSGTGVVQDLLLGTENRPSLLRLGADNVITVAGDILPSNQQRSLGSDAFRWSTFFFGSTVDYVDQLDFKSQDGTFLKFNTDPTTANIDLISPVVGTGLAQLNLLSVDTAITGVTDNAGDAVFTHAGDQTTDGATVKLANFVTETNYNVDGVVTASTATTFQVVGLAFTDDDAGSFSEVQASLTYSEMTGFVDLVSISSIGLSVAGGASVGVSQLGGGATSKVLEYTNSAGTDGAAVATYVGSITPLSNITADPGDIYYRAVNSAPEMWLHKGSGSDDTSWEEVVTLGSALTAVTTSDVLGTDSIIVGNSGVDVEAAESGASSIKVNAGRNQIQITPDLLGTAGIQINDVTTAVRLQMFFDDNAGSSSLVSSDGLAVTAAGVLALSGSSITLNGDTPVVTSDTLTNNTFILGNGGQTIDAAEVGGAASIRAGSNRNEMHITPALNGTATYKLFDSNQVDKLDIIFDDNTNTSAINSDAPLTVAATIGDLNLTSTAADVIVTSGDDIVLSPTGNVGINQSNPTDDLHITNTSAAIFLEGVGATFRISAGVQPDLLVTTAAGVCNFDLRALALDGVSNTVYRVGLQSGSTGRNTLALTEPSSSDIQTSFTTSAGSSFINAFGGGLAIHKSTVQTNYVLDIDASVGDVVGLFDSKGVTFEAGNSVNTNSTDLYFNRGDVGFNQSEFYIFNNNDNVPDMRAFHMNYTDAGAVGGLSIRYDGSVAIGLGENEIPTAIFQVRSTLNDTFEAIKLETTGTNGGVTSKFVGDRDPTGVVTASSASEYIRVDSGDSAHYINRSPGDSGTVWREGDLIGENVINVWKKEDFGTVGGGEVLCTSTQYIMKAAVDLGTDSLNPNGNEVAIRGIRTPDTGLTYTGTGIMLDASSGGSFLCDGVELNTTGVGATLVEVADRTARLTIANSTVTMTGAGSKLGTVDSNIFQTNNISWIGFTEGFTMVNTFVFNSQESLWQPSASFSSDAVLEFTGAGTDIVNVHQQILVFVVGGINFLNLDPLLLTDGTLFLRNTIDILGTATMFFDGVTGPIASIADNSLAATAIGSVADDGFGVAVFNTGGAIPLVGQTITISGFTTNTNYNGTFICSASSGGAFKAALISDQSTQILFGTTEAGSVLGAAITVTDVAHGLTELDTLQISDTINYNFGYTIFNVTTDTFDVSATFVITETGTWSDGSLTEESRNTQVSDNAGFKDSFNIGSVVVNGNTTATTIANQNEWTALDFNGTAVEGSNNVLWTLLDTTTGEIRYDGDEEIFGTCTAPLSCTSTGGSQEFQFRVVKNGSPLPDAVVSAREIGSDMGNLTVLAPITAVSGDTFQIEAQNIDGTSDIMAQNMSFEVK